MKQLLASLQALLSGVRAPSKVFQFVSQEVVNKVFGFTRTMPDPSVKIAMESRGQRQ
jgi:hypothetical protein